MRATQVFSGLGWTAGAAAINLIAQLVFTAVLARAIEPAAFGLMAMAIIALRFVSYFAQMGAAQTLVQAPTLSLGLPTAAMATALVVSTALYGLLVVAAPLFVAYFSAPGLAEVMMVFGLVLPLTAASALPLALLRRAGRFQASSTIDVLAYTLGYGAIGSALALTGHGVWSLVWAALAQQAIALLLSLGLSAYPLTLAVQRSDWARAWGLGSGYSVIGFLEFLWANVETLLVGRWQGPVALGLLNRAQLLCNLPVEQVVNAGSKVLFPAMSSLQGQPERVRNGFLVTLLATALISVPISAGVCAAAPELVRAVLGPQWGDATALVRVLALSVPPMFLYVACGVAMDSVAALRPKLWLQLGLLLVKVALLVATASFGLVTMAVAIVFCELLRLTLGLFLVCRLLSVPAAAVRQVLQIALLLGLLVFVGVSAVSGLTENGQLHMGIRLVADALVGAGLLVLVLYALLPRWRSFEPILSFDSLCQRLVRVQGLVRR
jgi:lipopolysaccharide exporter